MLSLFPIFTIVKIVSIGTIAIISGILFLCMRAAVVLQRFASEWSTPDLSPGAPSESFQGNLGRLGLWGFWGLGFIGLFGFVGFEALWGFWVWVCGFGSYSSQLRITRSSVDGIIEIGMKLFVRYDFRRTSSHWL